MAAPERRSRWVVLPTTPPRAALALLLVLAFALAAWRVAMVLAGPDLDTDAYGHHAIGRQILSHPGDLGVHWVWLPLFHYLQAICILLFGATLTSVRLANVLVSGAIPFALYGLLRARARDEGREPDGVPLIAAILTALSPLSMQMGTTGQPEPMFGLLVLLVLWALQAKRPLLGAALLSATVMVRYEGWALLSAVAGLTALGYLLRNRRSWFAVPWLGVRALLPVVVPALVILAWAAARRPHDPSWFWFVKGTRTFANEALGAKSSLDRGFGQLFADLHYYAYGAAWQVIGYPLLLVPLGLPRAFRREGVLFTGANLAILAFITYAWIQRGSLGLYRHFMVLVPFYATMAAHGACALGDGARALVRRLGASFSQAGAARMAVTVFLGTGAALFTYQQLDGWMADWRDKMRFVFTDRFYVAAALRTLPEGTKIFCDEGSIEIFSGIDRRRFDRGFIGGDEATIRRIQAAANGREVFVATWSSKLGPLSRVGELYFRPPGSSPKFEEGLAIVRLRGK